jgi:hypothetical protein
MARGMRYRMRYKAEAAMGTTAPNISDVVFNFLTPYEHKFFRACTRETFQKAFLHLMVLFFEIIYLMWRNVLSV